MPALPGRSESPEISSKEATARSQSKPSHLQVMFRRWKRTSDASFIACASSNESSDDEHSIDELERSPPSRKEKAVQLSVIDLQVCHSPNAPSSPRQGGASLAFMGDTSPFSDASFLGGDASPLGDASLFTDASPKDGCDFSCLVEIGK